jgi:arsenite methyltransferase
LELDYLFEHHKESMETKLRSETAVRERYSAAAQQPEAALCCPVEYDSELLKIIPREVIEKDYGCGNPAQHLKPGETVLDLGSGTGKICFIAAQVVGREGKVIGVDMNEAMLEVARRNEPVVAERLGYSNVEFRKGRIQDLGLDLEKLNAALQENPIRTAAGLFAAEELASSLRSTCPLVADAEVDVVVSNCVLNLVENKSKRRMFEEIYRVLKEGGRAVISDIVSDEPVPLELQNDPQLWSGCISGAFTEEGFLLAFSEAGFHGIEIVKRDEAPWRTVQGIEFRSVTVRAHKSGTGPGRERGQAMIYLGPFQEILTDSGLRFQRGRSYAVSDQTYELLQQEPYQGMFAPVAPRWMVPLEKAREFSLEPMRLRHPREAKGFSYHETKINGPARDPKNGSCC